MDQVLRALPEPIRRIVGPLLSGDGDTARSQRGALVAFAIRIASAGILFFSQVLLARWLGTFEFGVYTYVWVWVTVTGTMCCLGFATTVVRFIPEYTEHGALDDVRGFLRAGRGVSFITATVAAALGLLYLQLFEGHTDSTYHVPLTLALLCLPAFAVTDFQDGVGRSKSWIGLALVPPYILRPALLLGFVAIAVAIGHPRNAATAAAALLFATWITAIVQYVLQKRRMAPVLPSGNRNYRLKFWFFISLPVLLLDAFTLMLMNMDILLLELYVEPDQIGIYFAAARCIMLISFVHFAVAAAVMPRFSGYFAKGDNAGIRQLLTQSRLWTVVPSLAGAVVLLAIGKPLLWLFGPDFTVGYPVMLVLVVGILARAAAGPTEGVLVVTGYQNLAAGILSASVVINVVLNLVLIPRYGLVGAAWATSITYVVGAVVQFMISRRVYAEDREGPTKDVPHVSPAE